MNMKLWNAIKQPPLTALKPIVAGRLKGKSDINPQWRIQALTEQFGQCGVGWRYAIDKLWTETGSFEQVMCFALVSLYTRHEDKWSDPIPGIGGSMLVTKESSGLHSSDEGYKMAVTDALSVAMKALGMAADVYLGNFDGSKYKVSDTKPITPTTGVWEKTSVDMQIYLKELASEVQGFVDAQNMRGAVETYVLANLDADVAVAFWTLFDSKTRSAMKVEHARLKQVGSAVTK